jgi:SAM-dependent methyltransferase
MEDRLERERQFHDHAFAEDTRATTARFYSVTESLFGWYEETLRSLAGGARALEYGCGRGSQAFALAAHGAHVTGLDNTPVAIEQARERGRDEGLSDRLDLRVMDAEHLELPDRSFDLVCGTGILHHLDLGRAYAEIARVLAPGGVAIFTEPLGHNPAINAYRNRTPNLRTVDEHPLLEPDLDLARRWFQTVDLRFSTLTALAAIPLRRTPVFEPVVAALDRVDALLFRVAPPLRRHAWMVGMVMRGGRSAAAPA